MIHTFHVTCIETTETTKSHLNDEILCKVDKDETYKVTLDVESDQYFTTDSQDRKVYVGYRDTVDTIHISNEFRLVGISENIKNIVYENVDLLRTL